MSLLRCLVLVQNPHPILQIDVSGCNSTNLAGASAGLLQCDHEVSKRIVFDRTKDLGSFFSTQNSLAPFGSWLSQRLDGIAFDQALLNAPIEGLFDLADDTVARRRTPRGFLSQPIRYMNWFDFANSEPTAGIRELLNDPTMSFIAVEILLHPIQKLIEQHNDFERSSIKNLRRLQRWTTFDRRQRHQPMKRFFRFSFRAFALRERDLLATQANIPSVSLPSIPRLRRTHRNLQSCLEDSATESSAVLPFGKLALAGGVFSFQESY